MNRTVCSGLRISDLNLCFGSSLSWSLLTYNSISSVWTEQQKIILISRLHSISGKRPQTNLNIMVQSCTKRKVINAEGIKLEKLSRLKRLFRFNEQARPRKRGSNLLISTFDQGQLLTVKAVWAWLANPFYIPPPKPHEKNRSRWRHRRHTTTVYDVDVLDQSRPQGLLSH